MAENKTQPTKASVAAYLNALEDDSRRKDAKSVDKMMRAASGDKPVMWGENIVGYGSNGDWMRMGFSPRKTNLTLYIMDGFKEYSALLDKLGKHKTGKSCLYIKRLTDVDVDVLQKLMERSYKSVG